VQRGPDGRRGRGDAPLVHLAEVRGGEEVVERDHPEAASQPAELEQASTSLQATPARTMTGFVETPSFTFRLERVRSLREQAEDRAREALAQELALRVRGAAVLEAAHSAANAARDAGRGAQRQGAAASDLLAAQLWMERAERITREAALDLDRQDAEVAARRQALADAAREREVIEKLKRRQAGDHEREWARRAQNELDEVALGVHRRGSFA